MHRDSCDRHPSSWIWMTLRCTPLKRAGPGAGAHVTCVSLQRAVACQEEAVSDRYTIVPLLTVNKVVRHATPVRGGLCCRTNRTARSEDHRLYALSPDPPPAPRSQSHSPASARPKFATCATATRCRGLRVSFRIRRIHSSPTDRRTRGAVELAKNGVLPQLPSLLTYELMTRFM